MNIPEGLTAEDLAEIARMEPEDERCVVGEWEAYCNARPEVFRTA